MSRPSRPPVATRPLAPVVLVTGKGGVGKTTIAASLALVDAELRGQATFVEFGDGLAGKRALAGTKKLVEHIVMRPDEALRRGAAPLFGSATLAKLALGNFAMKPLLKAAPAIRELALLEAVRQLAADRPGVRIVVDMPATGHSVAWLRVPAQGKALLGSGPLFEMCDRIARELLAPGHASIVIVTLPEALVLEETLELCAAIEDDVGLRVDRIVINRVPVSLPAVALEQARALASAPGPLSAAYASLATVLDARAAASEDAVTALEPLLRRQHALWRVPLAPVDPSARDVARWLVAEGAG